MSKIKIAVLISGGGSNLQALIEASQSWEDLAEITLVVSSQEDAYGLQRARKYNIPTVVLSKKRYASAEEREQRLLDLLEEHSIDLMVLAGYLAMVPRRIVERYENRMMNIHPSLLPSFSGKGYYGIKVHEEALDRGVKVTGATVHFVNEITDGGPIILQKTIEVNFEDDALTLQKRVLEIEHEILPKAVKLFAEGKIEVINNKVKINGEVKPNETCID
ncbi:phosphoribosylglycinamide formyltransferase [Alkaliphilus metalliredigens QYMF]|uniref:Phosphoribosylglycinamide formyltransferase n=1 Tax=Alkaliphilus metalliredigens (strain QYMF) TaxID=293826 RepID=A6TLS6_ALKMQ|nr:phosphoribosylglycinamide formyltransferase [Alkaliphilus metalliredigens]ABR47144.1 phosphoribosylglycinamide formyltransferase [Alkaliphilus metalliredigens QYMF]